GRPDLGARPAPHRRSRRLQGAPRSAERRAEGSAREAPRSDRLDEGLSGRHRAHHARRGAERREARRLRRDQERQVRVRGGGRALNGGPRERVQELFQQLANGIAWGSIYALIALGYTMVYGILRLINFAHGDVYMVGAFVAYFTARALGAGGAQASPAYAVLVLVTAMAAC